MTTEKINSSRSMDKTGSKYRFAGAGLLKRLFGLLGGSNDDHEHALARILKQKEVLKQRQPNGESADAGLRVLGDLVEQKRRLQDRPVRRMRANKVQERLEARWQAMSQNELRKNVRMNTAPAGRAADVRNGQ